MKNSNTPQWAWPGYPGGDLFNAWAQFRRVFDLTQVPETCVIHVTCDQAYRLFVNGQRVSEGPVRGMPSDWFYDTLDIAPWLRAGRNVIAALGHNPGLGHHSYIHSGFAGFLLWEQTGALGIQTGPNWRQRQAPDVIRKQVRLSIQLGWQEWVDGRLSDGDWTAVDYEDSHWPLAEYWFSRAIGCAPWVNLQERDIPLLRNEWIAPEKIVARAHGQAAGNWREEENLAVLFTRERDLLQRVQECARNVEIAAQDAGSVQMWVIDAGREFCASAEWEIEGATGGEHLDFLPFEGWDGAKAGIEPLKGCSLAPAHRYICREGGQRHETFWPLGGRYSVVAVHGATRGFRLRLRLRHREYPFERKGRVSTPAGNFKEIYEMSVHTQQLCALDSYVDCPAREQGMWWGDIVTHFGNSQRFAADDRLLVRGLRLIAQQRLPNGLTYALAPTKAHECVVPDFTLAWIRSIWLHYWFSGKTDMVIENREKILEAFAYFAGEADKNDGLLATDPRFWLFLDWAETFKDGTPTLYNLEYLETLECAEKLFTVAGCPRDAKAAGKQAQSLKKAITKRLWDRKKKEPVDGLTWKGEAVPRKILHNIVRCILLDIAPAEHQRWANELLLPFVRGERPRGDTIYGEAKLPGDSRSKLTPYFMHFAFQALAKLGHKSDVLDCISRWWGEMITRDLKTTEEVWDATPGIESLCHAWTAHPIQHFSDLLLGIVQDAAGWSRICYQPVLVGSAAEGVVDTPHGAITTSWKREGNQVHYKLELPEGIEAVIQLPGIPQETVPGGRTHVFQTVVN